MKNLINKILGFINLKIVNKRISEIKNSDFFLYQYDSYEEYEELQVKHNLSHNAALDGTNGKTMIFKFRRLI